MTLAVLAPLLSVVLAVSLVGWWHRAPVFPAVAAGILGVASLVAASAPSVGRLALIVCTTLAVMASAAGGGPLTVAILQRASASTTPRTHEPGRPDPTPAEDVLRGGAWIGALERLAVTATLIAGWPEGIAVVLAVKGLARYPELRSPGAGASERFIIGTFTSVLWAAACAVTVLLLR
jgi:F0F1-type ATP synthase membrane subunit c/vacuolar-type H+-ATPase subunit K